MLTWTDVDTRNAALASVVPIGLGIVKYNSLRPGQSHYVLLKTSTKPNWMDFCPMTFGLVELAALSPLGYASYLVYKYGGGFEYQDTTAALALYGMSLLFFGGCRPLYDKKDYKWLLFNKTVAFGTGIGFAYAFYKIHRNAGLLAVPYSLLSGFCMYLYYKLFQMNDKKIKF